MANYIYFSKGETILLKCMSGVKTADWIGPAQNTTNPSLIPVVDHFGKQKIWQTTQYTNHRNINPIIPNFRRIRVVGIDRDGDFDLQISNASYCDIGFYRCAIDPVEGNPLTKSYILQLKNEPKVLIISEQRTTVSEGNSTMLCCEIDSNPNISFILWSKDKKTMIDDADSYCLVFENLTRHDSGNYTCLSGNEIGNGSFETSLIVFYPPSVYLEYKIFSVNESIRDIHCKGDGIPNNLTFSRVEHKSNFNEHIRFLEVSSYGIATLPFLNETDRYQDTGVYSCNASNGVPDMEGIKFQQGEAKLVFAGPPVFASDNKKLQYGKLGKPIEITIKAYSTTDITCHYLNAIGRLSSLESIWNISSKIVLMRIHFHGVYITVNGIEVTFHLAILHHFQTFNVTVCNNVSTNSVTVEVRQIVDYSLEEKVLSSQGLAIIVLVMIIVILVAGMGIYIQNDNPMISMVERTVVENGDTALVPAEQSSTSSNYENSESEHLDDGYEYPYTTLVVNNRTEEEHVYLNTRNSIAFENAACGRSFELLEQDETKTHCYANQGQANVNINDDGNNSKETDNNSDRTLVHQKNKAEYINLLLKQ
ncbi:unnamed protein product [Mytilus coruscus]|uniref:Ig-like domain-containing protein n=1 Tax=Mytilus coruscus TaxID=42192 RepID=A0A6J8D8V0_MYTCO|nr:unnamed protein product [Mytilus coruscus]